MSIGITFYSAISLTTAVKQNHPVAGKKRPELYLFIYNQNRTRSTLLKKIQIYTKKHKIIRKIHKKLHKIT